MNNLRVNKPFSVLDKGDILVPVNNGTEYEIECTEDYTDNCEGKEYTASFNSKFSISKSYADELVKMGVLSVVEDNSKFKNVFEEIDSFLSKYKKELSTIDEDCKDLPDCVKVEKTTVLKNLIAVLAYLKSLKK